MSTQDRLARAQKVVGRVFRQTELLEMALTHPSYAAEHDITGDYERLEFLGDAILGFIVSEQLYRALPDAPEGELTRRKHNAVSRDALASVAEELGLGDLVRLGKGADASGDRARSSLLENTFEALVGALYLDGGLEAAASFAIRVLESRYGTEVVPDDDAKSALQQYAQGRTGLLPEYRITQVVGPPHSRTFSSEVTLDGRVLGIGDGPSKRAAEKAAAAAALEALDADDSDSSRGRDT